jgi:DNA topoisomerase-1
MEASDVDLQTALQLLSLPRTLGPHPTTQEPVVVSNGRYGPYVKCGAETRSLPVDVSPLSVDMETALAILAQPKTGGRRRAAPKEPLQTFAESPITGEPVKLLDGRYGPYVTDGTTNASLPKGAAVESLTFEQALALLADRAGKSTPKRGGAKAKRAKKAAPKTPRKKKKS